MNARTTGARLGALLLSLLLLAGCNVAIQTTPSTPAALNPAGAAQTPAVSGPASAQPTGAAKAGGAAVATGAAPAAKAAGATPGAKADPAVAAVVNGEVIPMADYQREIAQARNFLLTDQKVNPNTPEGQQALETTYNQVLESMIAEALIRQYAKKNNIIVSDEELAASIAALTKEMGGQAEFDKALTARGLTRDQFLAVQRDQLLGNKVREVVTKDVPQTVEQVHARHILTQTVDEAVKAANRIQSGEDFGRVARDLSQDPGTAKADGDLGWFPRGLMVPEFEQVAFSLPVKQLSSPVQSQFGWHIIEVLEKETNRQLPEDRWQLLRQARFQSWLEDERNAATIERTGN